jgi:uncharacterized protein (TIGR03437 family)
MAYPRDDVCFAGQLNAQIPYSIDGNATIVLRTPVGVSDNYYVQIRATAPTVFRNAVAGTTIATVVRKKNNELVTLSNPAHRGEDVVVYLTGMGRTLPAIEAGIPDPMTRLSRLRSNQRSASVARRWGFGLPD